MGERYELQEDEGPIEGLALVDHSLSEGNMVAVFSHSFSDLANEITEWLNAKEHSV